MRKPSRARRAWLARGGSGGDGIGSLVSPLSRCPGAASCLPPSARRRVEDHLGQAARARRGAKQLRQDSHARHGVGARVGHASTSLRQTGPAARPTRWRRRLTPLQGTVPQAPSHGRWLGIGGLPAHARRCPSRVAWGRPTGRQARDPRSGPATPAHHRALRGSMIADRVLSRAADAVSRSMAPRDHPTIDAVLGEFLAEQRERPSARTFPQLRRGGRTAAPHARTRRAPGRKR
jgi:hypothetical protein